MLHINTYDTANRALAATKREWNAAIRLLYNAGTANVLLLIPKLGPNKTLDWDGFDRLIHNILDELCEPAEPNKDVRERSVLESLIRVFKKTTP